MAKYSSSLAFRPTAPAPVVVMAPGRGKFRRRAAAVARIAGRRAGRAARQHAVPAMAMAIGGAIAGALDANGVFNKLPALGGSRALTLAIAGYAATRFSKHPMVRNVGLAAMAVGAFDAVKFHLSGPAVTAPAPKAAAQGPHGTEGHDDPSGHQGDGGPF